MWCPPEGLAGVCWFSWNLRRAVVVAESKVRQRPPCDGTGRRRATRKSASKRVCSEAQERLNAPVSFLMKSPMPYATGFKLVSSAIGNGGKLRYWYSRNRSSSNTYGMVCRDAGNLETADGGVT